MGFTTEEEATDFAKKALNALKWVGWKYKVWENLRWHVKLYCGPVSAFVSGATHRKWCAMISSDPNSATGGGGLWTRASVEYADTPEAAVEAEFRRFKEVEKLFRTIHTAVLKATTSKG